MHYYNLPKAKPRNDMFEQNSPIIRIFAIDENQCIRINISYFFYFRTSRLLHSNKQLYARVIKVTVTDIFIRLYIYYVEILIPLYMVN